MPTFKYGKIMVDKARNEIAAIRLLELAGEADGHLLCYFHFLQEWERFVRSAESGVSGKEAQHRVMQSLAHLAHVKSEAMFEAKVRAGGRLGRQAAGSTRPTTAQPPLPGTTIVHAHPC